MPLQYQSASQASEDQTDFAAGNHSNADGEAVHAMLKNAQSTNLLPEYRSHGNEPSKNNSPHRRKTTQPHKESEEDEEPGDDEGRERKQHFPPLAFPASQEGLIVTLSGDAPRRKRTHNWSQAN